MYQAREERSNDFIFGNLAIVIPRVPAVFPVREAGF
jgi:hypothetical protein